MEHFARLLRSDGGDEHLPIRLGVGGAGVERDAKAALNRRVEGALLLVDLLRHEVQAELLVGEEVVQKACKSDAAMLVSRLLLGRAYVRSCAMQGGGVSDTSCRYLAKMPLMSWWLGDGACRRLPAEGLHWWLGG